MTVADLAHLQLSRVADLRALCRRVRDLHAEGRTVVLLAGGTDWMVEQEMRKPFGAGSEPAVIDVSRLPELRGISLPSPGLLRIGAATTFWEMRRHPLVLEHAPIIARMAADVGAVQIQARGTFGGNLATASPAADGVAALAALDAVIVVENADHQRRIPFPEYATGYKQTTRADDEVIVAVEIVLPKPSATWIWRKVGTRKAQAISKVALAAIAEREGPQVVRCGLGMASVGPTTALLARTRELFLSTALDRIDDDAIDKAVDGDIRPIDDVRSTGEYRLHVAKACVRELARKLRG